MRPIDRKLEVPASPQAYTAVSQLSFYHCSVLEVLSINNVLCLASDPYMHTSLAMDLKGRKSGSLNLQRLLCEVLGN